MRGFKVRTRIAAGWRAHPRLVVASSFALGLVTLVSAWTVLRTGTPRSAESPLDVSVVSTGPALRPTRPVTFSEGCVNSRCHTSMENAAKVHAPIAQGACQSCHASDAGGHTYPLLQPKAELCSACHAEEGRFPVQHARMSEDGCLSCHDAHASPNKALLTRSTTLDTCAACHPRSQGSAQHASYADGGCGVCHTLHGSSDRSMLAAGSTVETCRRCHPEVTHETETRSHSHQKVEGSCTACHDPHVAQFKGMLASTPRESCVKCHKDVGSVLAQATVSHDAILTKDECLRCHQPHASDQVAMLKDSEEATCLSCHSKPVVAADKRTIAAMAPFAATEESPATRSHRVCSGCHSVHGGNQARLLNALSTRLPVEPYDRRNYALCFGCHDPSLGDRGGSTQFRDGDRNLHDVHLHAGERSRGCATCHAVHAGNEPRLIAKSTHFEGSPWAMPMGFVPTADGGKCGSGCHEPLGYSRTGGGLNSLKNRGAP